MVTEKCVLYKPHRLIYDKNSVGMNMTTAFNIFAKTVVRQHGIPFPVALDTPNAETLAAIEDVNKRRNMRGPFNSVQALMEDLNADD